MNLKNYTMFEIVGASGGWLSMGHIVCKGRIVLVEGHVHCYSQHGASGGGGVASTTCH